MAKKNILKKGISLLIAFFLYVSIAYAEYPPSIIHFEDETVEGRIAQLTSYIEYIGDLISYNHSYRLRELEEKVKKLELEILDNLN